MRLMIVDDHIGVRNLIRRFVVTPQDIVCECASGDEAVRVAPGFKPDAVTMDIRMPGTCGLTATAAIHTALPETRVIIVTSHDEVDLRSAAARAGAVGFVSKDDLSKLSGLLRLSEMGGRREPRGITETAVTEQPITGNRSLGMPRALLVLLVDTCANNFYKASQALAACGYKPVVEQVQTSEAFLQALDRGRWDLILTTSAGPVTSGAKIIAAVRERNLSLPVVCLNANQYRDGTRSSGNEDTITHFDSGSIRSLQSVIQKILNLTPRKGFDEK